MSMLWKAEHVSSSADSEARHQCLHVFATHLLRHVLVESEATRVAVCTVHEAQLGFQPLGTESGIREDSASAVLSNNTELGCTDHAFRNYGSFVGS